MEQSNGTRWERPDAPLGTLVYRAGLLSKEKLEAALQEGQATGRRLGEILLQKGWIDEKDLARLLAGQKGLQFVSLKGRGYERETALLLPERVCRYHTAVAMESSADRVLVAIADPTDDSALQEIRDEIGRPIELVVAATSEIRNVLDDVFAAGAATLAPTEAPPAPTAISPVGELGLRIAAPAPDPEPEPEPEPEPVALVPDPEPAPEPEPEPVAEAAPVVIPLPEPEPSPPADVPLAEEPVAEEPVAPAADLPTVEPVSHQIPDPVPAVPEPTIERNESAHVSVAFHTPPAVEAEPETEPEPEAVEPEPAAAPEAQPVAAAAPPVEALPESRPAPADAPYCLVLNLVDGDQVDVAYFADSNEATAAARALVAGITRDAEWPQVGRTFYPPERIASVEIRERQRFSGNASRAGWGGTEPPSVA